MSLYAVMESTLTVSVDDLLRAVFLGYVGEATAPLQIVRGRVVEEHQSDDAARDVEESACTDWSKTKENGKRYTLSSCTSPC